MSFIWPSMLLFLVVIPLLTLFYLHLQRRRRLLAARSGGLGFVQSAGGRRPGIRRHIPPMLFLAGLTVLVVSLARPQMAVSLPRIEGTVILAFDVSGSMAANDIAPTRMEAAKEAARIFVQSQPSSVLVGVVAFSDGGFAVQPPTDDPNAILASIDRLTPQRGTSLGQGILASLNTIAGERGQGAVLSEDLTQAPPPSDAYGSAMIVLLSDGENTAPPDPFSVAQTAADLGVPIYTIGVGSAEGATLDVEGFMVHSRLDEATLEQIAFLTGGEYHNAQSQDDLRQIYANIQPRLVVKPEDIEVTSLFAGISLLVLLAGAAFSLFWFSRLP
ncbi:MAG: VWA domain-containing protein [Chloroflexota bacterium]|nr:MAG: VWA domain-containing protein [Chloroflexota bacterium]